MPVDPHPWMIYALGGGWGHLMRALALARVVLSHHSVEILCSSPYLEAIYRSPFWSQYFQDRPLQIHHLPPDIKPEQARYWIAEILIDRDLSCLIVDTFPRGLIGDLVEILPQIPQIPKVFIHRDLNPVYVERYDLRSFVSQHYQQILIPGDFVDPPLADLGFPTAPWLISNAADLPPRKQIRSDLYLFDPDAPLIVICASGQESEQAIYGELTQQISTHFPQISVRCLAATLPPGCRTELWICHWPGIECLWAADLVLGGGGYHTIHECMAVGRPLIAFPWKRQYDRQRVRLLAAQSASSTPIQSVHSIQMALEAIEIWLKDRHPQPRSKISYPNGAVEAAQILNNDLGSQSIDTIL